MVTKNIFERGKHSPLVIADCSLLSILALPNQMFVVAGLRVALATNVHAQRLRYAAVVEEVAADVDDDEEDEEYCDDDDDYCDGGRTPNAARLQLRRCCT